MTEDQWDKASLCAVVTLFGILCLTQTYFFGFACIFTIMVLPWWGYLKLRNS